MRTTIHFPDGLLAAIAEDFKSKAIAIKTISNLVQLALARYALAEDITPIDSDKEAEEILNNVKEGKYFL